MQKAADQIREMQAIWARADAEGRELSQWERKDMEERLLRIKSAQAFERLEGNGNGGPYNTFSDPAGPRRSTCRRRARPPSARR
jgi:hypothetical protein